MTETDWVIGRNGEGVPVVRYLLGEREGRPWADLLEVVDGNDGTDPVEFVRTELAGWVVSGTPEFGLALLEHGATVLRHAHAMRRDLVADPPPADWAGAPLRGGLRAAPCDRAPEDLFEAWRAAFAPGHPDHFAGDDRQALAQRIAPLLAGEVIGPVLPSSLLAVDAQDRVVAGLVLTDRGGLPWIADVFRHPELGYRGLGADLLRRAVADAAERGLVEVQLAVTDSNPARRLYESLGFEVLSTSLTVIVPEKS
ncbi:GNAT family N-acetyltransferase [Kitasatospora sp. NPDC059811]|uniref:GNAT family N-acetyltransferase n=1 Tax=Streptomycetaceae TaxID=2062 RepID=UPI001FCC4864|nr:GNAT family N-acetyltransferase [Streptomyces sp. MJM8645]